MPLPAQHSASRPSTTTAGTRLIPYRFARSAAALSRMSNTSIPHEAHARRLMSATASSHAEQPALNTSIFRFVAMSYFSYCARSHVCRLPPSAFASQEQFYHACRLRLGVESEVKRLFGIFLERPFANQRSCSAVRNSARLRLTFESVCCRETYSLSRETLRDWPDCDTLKN